MQEERDMIPPLSAGRAGALAAVVALATLAAMAFWLSLPWRGLGCKGSAFIDLRSTGAEWYPDSPLFIAVFASDARPGEIESRSDAIQIIAIPPQKRSAVLVSLPRDAWVPIPGHGRNRINTAYQYGGAALLVRVIREQTGIPIHYYAELGFDAFVRFVDELGGLTVSIAAPIVNDRWQHITLPVGPTHMDGDLALRFARSRAGTPQGDLSREENHGEILLSLLARLQKDATDPERARRVFAILRRNVKTDVSPLELWRIGRRLAGIEPRRVERVLVPGMDAVIEGKDVILLTPYRLFDQIRIAGNP
jgi:LCP family protein required for cell wall assembly